MTRSTNRREFIRRLGLGAAALPFAGNLPSLGLPDNGGRRKQRLIVMFSPNGVVQPAFWPDIVGVDFDLKEILQPLAPYKNRTLVLNGVSDRIRGDGDNHMRGIACLLTGIELFPGNIQGGSHSPAGWATGLSIDQEIKNFLQRNPETRTRFGSLELGVMVPNRADPWTRLAYAGPNQPIAPIADPYQTFDKLYGRRKDQKTIASILDDLKEDLAKLRREVGKDDRRLLDEHATFVRETEQQLSAAKAEQTVAAPKLPGGVMQQNDNLPRISKMQIDLLVSSFLNDSARVATLQYTNSVGQARMKWLGINDGHHTLSHKPDSDTKSQNQLIKINKWFCEQLAYLVGRLAATPEPGTDGTLLDNTLVIWTNELGKGNSHTLHDIPFVLVGGGLDFRMGRSVLYRRVPHNRLLLALAHGFGHRIKTFGNPRYCAQGPLDCLT